MRVVLFNKEEKSFEEFDKVEGIQGDRFNEEITLIYFPIREGVDSFYDRFPTSRYQISSVDHKNRES